MYKQLLGIMIILSCSFPALAKPSMVCFENQASCNQSCIAKGDMQCVERCTADAQACVDEESAREKASQQAQRSKQSSTPDSDRSVTYVGNNAGKKKMVYGPEQLEAVAVCWQNKRNSDHYRCDGPVQDTIMADEPLDKQLGFAGCTKPRSNDGARTIKGGKAMVYLCGYGLSGSDRDVAKKYGFTVQRNKYQCTGSKNEKYQCRENFQMTD